ncbi:MAG TPA: DUF885 domain-containing protein [Actinopolymorphaceae bacterium]
MRFIDQIADEYVDDFAATDPIGATYAGISGQEHRLTDYSPDGFAARHDLTTRTLADLEACPTRDEAERVAVEAMRERLGIAAELYDAGITTSTLNVCASPLQDIRSVFDLMPTESADDWEAIAARLAEVPNALRGFGETLGRSAAEGRRVPRRQVQGCIDQIASWLPPDQDLFGELVARAEVDGALRTRLEKGADDAKRALADFSAFLGELLPAAPTRDAVGRDRYAVHSRYFLGSAIDLDETYAWGWHELHRIEQEMAEVATEIVPGGSVDDAVAALERDPARNIADKNAFRDWMQAEADRAVEELAGRHFDIPEPIRRIECRIAPTSDGAIYYTGPSEDFTRPGRMWWSVPKDVTSFATWKELTTVYHEGVPGHHLQIAQTAYRKDVLNRWQRLLCWVSGHGEGWALYAERLMDELGYLSEPGARLGMLDSQAFRAARVIVDIGMHLELPIPDNRYHWRVGERWTPQLGLEFLLAHCRTDEPFLRFELDRYLGWPGQAPSYKVGERIWLRAREAAKQRKGADFDLVEFHRAALDLGSIGLDPLQAGLARL